MARLRINQGINLILDASTTDFIVKSLSGPNGDLLLNGRNWSVEVRIDEDNSGGDIFKITKGPNGSTRLLTVENPGYLNVGGFDLKLGTSDQITRGNSGLSRALVKDHNTTLAINYAGDFAGGTRIDGPGLGIGGMNYVYNTTPSFQIPGADGNAKWLIVRDTANGSGIISFNSTKDVDGGILGSLVWTREGGQSDGHRQVAGIVAVQSGTGALAGSELRFYTKSWSEPVQRMVIDREGRIGIGVNFPTEKLEIDGNVRASRFISTIPTGSPPLQVSSTTKVNNLNADLLDGYDSTDFTRKAENATITGSWTFSATPSFESGLRFTGGTSTWTSNGWVKVADLFKGQALVWRAGGGLSVGLGVSSNTLYFSSSTVDDNSAPASYPIVFDIGNGRIGIGTTEPTEKIDIRSGNIRVDSNSIIKFDDKRIINVYLDHGGDTNTRYYYLGKVHSGAGILKVQGILGGHTPTEGRANVDLQFSARDGFRVDGEVIGQVDRADIYVYAPSGDSYTYVYLVTKIWALVNLELSAVGEAFIEFNGSYTTTEPTFGENTITPIFKLSTDTSNILSIDNSGNMRISGNLSVAGTIIGNLNANAVGTTQLADNAVTTQKIANGAITTPKLADGSVTYAKLAQDVIDVIVGSGGARIFQTTIGDGTNSTYTVTHNFNTTNVEVSLTLLSTNEKIGAKVEVLNGNQIRVSFIAPIASNSVKVIVIG